MSEDADESQKTEEPTAKRLQKARSEGQIPKSREFISFMMLLVAVLLFTVIGPWAAKALMSDMRFFLAEFAYFEFTPTSIGVLMKKTLLSLVMITAPIILPFVLMYIISNIAQNGLVWSPKAITKIDLKRLSPLSGLKRFVSAQNMVEFIKGILKIVIVGVIGVAIITPQIDVILFSLYKDYAGIFDDMLALVLQLIFASIVIMGFVAAADIAFQRYNNNKKLRMTKHEVKEENKEREGNPEVKRRLRQIRMERYNQMLTKIIPEADVVITNPTHFAVVLQYDQLVHEAPILTAKGQDHMAMLIRRLANDNDVPIVENPPLARAIYDNVEIGQEIQEEYYNAVAEVIRYVYDLRNKKTAA